MKDIAEKEDKRLPRRNKTKFFGREKYFFVPCMVLLKNFTGKVFICFNRKQIETTEAHILLQSIFINVAEQGTVSAFLTVFPSLRPLFPTICRHAPYTFINDITVYSPP